MMLYHSKTRRIKYVLDPPPPKKKGSRIRTVAIKCENTHCAGFLRCTIANTVNVFTARSRYVYTSVCLYQPPVILIFTRSRLNRLSDWDYKVIPSLKIITLLWSFFQAHVLEFMIFKYIRKPTKFQRKGYSF